MRIGDIAFVSTSFELYMDYYHRIQARSPFEQTFMIQLCAQPVKYGGVLGYVATERAVAGKGYSAIPFSCKVSPKGGQQFVENVIENLKEMR